MKYIAKLTLILIILLFSNKSIFAVEGYKDFTWGMSKDQVKNTSFCDFKAEDESQKGISALYCDDFPFGGKKRWGFFLFINNELLRIAVDIEKDEIKPLIEIFDESYKNEKNPKNPPLKTGGPVLTGTFSWDKDTILLKIIPVKKEKVQQMQMPQLEESEQDVIASLIYTSKDYEKKSNEKDKLILKDDAIDKKQLK